VNNHPEHIINEHELYSPAALLNTFNNSLSSPLLNRIFVVRGMYKKGKGVSYNGVYYDILKDELSDSYITLVIPIKLRHELKEGQIVDAQAYFTKRLSASTGRLDLILNVSSLLSRKEQVIDKQAIKAFELLQKKTQSGYKDVDALIKKKLYQKLPIKVTIILGTSAIIDEDIKHQLKDASLAYDISYVKTNMTRVSDILDVLRLCDGSDIVAISRGGGENIQIFDNPELSNAALNLKSCFVTAIGHAADEPLLQKIADKHFITPTALGQYFHDMYQRTMEDLINSKAKIISDLTKQVELSYQSKVQDLNIRLMETTKTLQEAKRENDIKLEKLSKKLTKTESENKNLWILFLIAAILMLVFLFR
jgi:exodeoxyribonuclease VII large subunit